MNGFLDKYRIQISIFLVFLILVGVGVIVYESKTNKNSSSSNNISEQSLDDKIQELDSRVKKLEDSQGNVAGQKTDNSPNDSNSKININSSDVNTLDKLPGIGPTRAQSIIDYRTKNGPFKSISDIQKISGIGQATYDKLKDLISI